MLCLYVVTLKSPFRLLGISNIQCVHSICYSIRFFNLVFFFNFVFQNFSVLESHHWRFAISCILESHVFDNLTSHQWNEFVSLLKSLILATDITQQGDYIAKFKVYLSSTSFYLDNTEHRHFILQIALKCADLGNPCRPWNLSKRWSEQICSEFYRQGDYERELNIPITPICNRFKLSMAAIQTGIIHYQIIYV